MLLLRSFCLALLILLLCKEISLAEDLNLGFMPGQLVSGKENSIFIVDKEHNQIKILDKSENLSVYAGSLKAGYKNGIKEEASFKCPHGIVKDKFGNLYVSDTANNVIRKIDQSGLVTTFAGAGVLGFADGKANEAKFNSPMGLAIDQEGNLYVADQRNQRIRKISTSGEVTTIAGNGFWGHKDGSSSEALFNYPEAVAVGMDGSVYVADKVNHVIRVIKNGKVGTLAGTFAKGFQDGALSSAMFNMPSDLSFDNQGNLLVVDSQNNAIRKIDLKSALVSTVIGASMSADSLTAPYTLLKVNDSQLLVTERVNLSLRKLAI